VIAQSHTPAADAAILLSCETLFAALAARFFLSEVLTPMQMAGGALIFACVLAIQLLPLLRTWRRSPMPAC
jgi:drug/metabolite transporter (DMT)-like permease